MKYIYLLCVLLFLSGCATAYKINKVSLGMSKGQVITAIGRPVSVSAQGQCEYLNYRFSETSDNATHGITTPYYVRLVHGKVESYGRMGDFDSTKDDRKIIVERKDEVKADIKTSSDKQDMYTELMKLNELKEKGIISEDEFATEKAEILKRH